jgi:hypothetical protein
LFYTVVISGLSHCGRDTELGNSVVRIFEPKRVEVMEGWTKLDNVELHTSYHSPDSIRVIRKRKNK